MKKLMVLLFGISLMGISLYGLSNNSYDVQVFINLGKPYLYSRAALIVVLAAYTFVPPLRLYIARAILSLSGMALLVLGLVTFYSPTLFGQLSSYVLLGDSFTLVEGGILAILLSAELSARRSRLIARSFLYLKSQLSTQPRRLTYPSLRPAIMPEAQS